MHQNYAEMKKLLIFVCCLTAITACHNDDDDDVAKVAERTVVIYMAGENNLGNYTAADLYQMREGSKYMAANNHLLIYVDGANRQEKPYLIEFANGVTADSIAMEEDLATSDPATLLSIMQKAINKCPAKEYALVLWGHASGWIIEKDSIASTVWNTPLKAPRKAYGIDNGINTTDQSGTWMNIPSMARALSMLPKLKFIFADCCSFQCAEVAYELRNVADYIIAAPSEIPGYGAPYHTVVPALFEKDTFWQSIVDKYFVQVFYDNRGNEMQTPLSVVKTSEMEQLAKATHTVLATFVPSLESIYPDMNGIIHYYYHHNPLDHKFYDMNDFIRTYASESDYATWKQAFDQAVIYKKMSTRWMTNVYWGLNYDDFTVTEEKYGGISMFVPQWYYQATTNESIKKLGWYYAAELADINW